jgi:hypothetical protein
MVLHQNLLPVVFCKGKNITVSFISSFLCTLDAKNPDWLAVLSPMIKCRYFLCMSWLLLSYVVMIFVLFFCGFPELATKESAGDVKFTFGGSAGNFSSLVEPTTFFSPLIFTV